MYNEKSTMENRKKKDWLGKEGKIMLMNRTQARMDAETIMFETSIAFVHELAKQMLENVRNESELCMNTNKTRQAHNEVKS